MLHQILLSFILALSWPQEWWAPVSESEREGWEVLPQDRQPPEVVLSKRTALGVFSNLAPTLFIFDGQQYASIEALWQSLKYPDPDDPKDPRHSIAGWNTTREQVTTLSGFDAKKAGDHANRLMKENGISWVSYKGKQFHYKDGSKGSDIHYALILHATACKVAQNSDVAKLLKLTQGLTLFPDHRIDSNAPKAYHFHTIATCLRDGNCDTTCRTSHEEILQ